MQERRREGFDSNTSKVSSEASSENLMVENVFPVTGSGAVTIPSGLRYEYAPEIQLNSLVIEVDDPESLTGDWHTLIEKLANRSFELTEPYKNLFKRLLQEAPVSEKTQNRPIHVKPILQQAKVVVKIRNRPAQPSPPIPLFTVPDFSLLFGNSRKNLLQKIAESFSSEVMQQKPYPALVLVGMQGIGKSQLAKKYAHLHQKEFHGGCLWINGANASSCIASFRSMGEKLGIFEGRDHALIEKVYQKLNERGKTLLIFDSAWNNQAIHPYLPPPDINLKNFSVIITSHNRADWLGYEQLELNCNQEEIQQDARDCIALHAAPFIDRPSDVSELATLLGYLPLAVVQAISYVNACKIKVSDYIQLFQTKQKFLLSKRAELGDYEYSVYTTFHLALDEIKKRSADALSVMQAGAYLNHQAISRTLLLGYFTQDSAKAHEMIGLLSAYALIDVPKDLETLNIHELIQRVIQLDIEEPEGVLSKVFNGIMTQLEGCGVSLRRREGLHQATDMLHQSFSYNRAKIAHLTALIPHIMTVLEHAERLQYFPKERTHLFYALGIYYLDAYYEIKKAKDYFEKAEAFSKHLSVIEKAQLYRQLFKTYLRNAVNAKKNQNKEKYFNQSFKYLQKTEALKVYEPFKLHCDYANFYLHKIEYFENETLDDYVTLEKQDEYDEEESPTKVSEACLTTLIPDRHKTYTQMLEQTSYHLDQANKLLSQNSEQNREPNNQVLSHKAILLHYEGSYAIKCFMYTKNVQALWKGLELFKESLALKKTLKDTYEIGRTALAIAKTYKRLHDTSQKKEILLLQHAEDYLKEGLRGYIAVYERVDCWPLKEEGLDLLAELLESQNATTRAIECRVFISNILKQLKREDIKNDRALIELFKKMGRSDQIKAFIETIGDSEKQKKLQAENNFHLRDRQIFDFPKFELFNAGNVGIKKAYLHSDVSVEVFLQWLDQKIALPRLDRSLSENNSQKESAISDSEGQQTQISLKRKLESESDTALSPKRRKTEEPSTDKANAAFSSYLTQPSFWKPVSTAPQILSTKTGQAFTVHTVASDGDCGYTAFGIERTAAYQLLKKHMSQIQSLLIPVIKEELLKENFIRYLIANKFASVPLLTLFQKHRSQVIQGLNADEIEHQWFAYANDLNVVNGYLNYDVKDKRIDAGWSHPGVLQALAHIRGIQLWIWTKQNKTLIPHEHYHKYTPIGAREAKHLLFVNGNHFELLLEPNTRGHEKSIFETATMDGLDNQIRNNVDPS